MMIEEREIEFESRIKRVQQIINDKQADACIVVTGVNHYYLTGRIVDGYLYIPGEGKPLLFVKRPLGIEGDGVAYIRKPEQIPDLLRQDNRPLPKRLLLESEVVSFAAALRLQAALGMPEIGNVSSDLRHIRSVKSAEELDEMRACARIHASVYRQIPSIYQKGMTDIDFQIELEHAMRRAGSIGIFRSYGENMDIFMGSILAGDNAAAGSPYDFALGGRGASASLPLGASGVALTPGLTLMVDMAGNYRPVMSDMTRTFVIERVAEEAYRAHQVSIDIHTAIMGMAKAGVPCAELYLLAEQMVKENGLEAYFMGTKQQAKFIGHGVGLEINEPPVLTARSKEVLQPGMAIAVEPKFVLPGIGAVGVENTYIVHEKELEKITLCEESLVVL
jgi:Xaa-Pro aminopeptidase